MFEIHLIGMDHLNLHLPPPNKYKSDLLNEVLWSFVDQRTAKLQAFKFAKTGDGTRTSFEHSNFSRKRPSDPNNF